MKDDLNASEKRLIAALDRLDACIDRAAEVRAGLVAAAPTEDAQDPDAAADALRAENQRLSSALTALHERQSELLSSYETRIAESNERLNAAGDEVARLSAANEALIAANRALAAAEAPGEDERGRALEAEIESLRASRAAEIGQMGDIIDSLDRMLGTPAAASDMPQPPMQVPAPEARSPAMVETPMPIETADALAGQPDRGAAETIRERD